MNPQNPDMNSSGTCCNDASKKPKTGVLTSHPVGAGLGAVGVGAAGGAAGGALGGPIGAVAGVAAGAVIGGLAGSAAAEALDPTVEAEYWKETYISRPYANTAYGYDEYAPAYRYGWESFGRRGGPGKTFESVEADLGRGWDKAKGASHLGWDKAKSATRDAWDRVKLAAHDLATPVAH